MRILVEFDPAARSTRCRYGELVSQVLQDLPYSKEGVACIMCC